MLSLSPATRIFVALEPVDMRKAFNGLSAAVQAVLAQDVLSGHLFVFTNRRRTRVKAIYWDGTGLVVYANQPSSYYTSSGVGRVTWDLCRDHWLRCGAIDEPVPSAAVLGRKIRAGIFVEPRLMPIVGLRGNEAVLAPTNERLFVDPQALRDLLFREQASRAQSIIA
jgi:transposase